MSYLVSLKTPEQHALEDLHARVLEARRYADSVIEGIRYRLETDRLMSELHEESLIMANMIRSTIESYRKTVLTWKSDGIDRDSINVMDEWIAASKTAIKEAGERSRRYEKARASLRDHFIEVLQKFASIYENCGLNLGGIREHYDLTEEDAEAIVNRYHPNTPIEDRSFVAQIIPGWSGCEIELNPYQIGMINKAVDHMHKELVTLSVNGGSASIDPVGDVISKALTAKPKPVKDDKGQIIRYEWL